MYVVTFYSYKGGVGRTMALLNTAVLLAERGKRVLLVDFDLEAPGLTTYGFLECARGHRGVVDYVTEYRSTLTAPSVSDYVVRCPIGERFLWVMPAGDSDAPGYSERLNSIDWEDLYSNQQGFLMFEDMKAQWSDFDGHGFDYVFIDSRTGHTDVGGICTRQLPDAVVIMFLPNEQNLRGLAPIVAEIRAEDRYKNDELRMHFCPSNVPDEFDEDDVLSSMLERASEELGYKDEVGVDQPAAVIHHWSSLELLKQPALAIARPKSRLANEYEQLLKTIISGNISDEAGAVEALARGKAVLQGPRSNRKSATQKRLTSLGQEILRLHPSDSKIAWSAARLFNLLREPTLEARSLTIAIEADDRASDARMARAFAYQNARRPEEAVNDLWTVLTSQDATKAEMQPAFGILTLIDEEWREKAAKLYGRKDLKFRARAILTEAMMTRRENLPRVIKDLSRLAKDEKLKPEQLSDALNKLQLARIGVGQFAAVASDLQRDELGGVEDVASVFNLAMAVWGRDGEAPTPLFRHIVNVMGGEGSDANAHQCLALANAIIGEKSAALTHLDIASSKISAGLVFSCWRYLFVTGVEMAAELEEMKLQLTRSGALMPPFYSEIAKGRAHITDKKMAQLES